MKLENREIEKIIDIIENYLLESINMSEEEYKEISDMKLKIYFELKNRVYCEETTLV